MRLYPSVVTCAAVFVLLNPLNVFAQKVRERLQPDFSAGFQRPDRAEANADKADSEDNPAITRWQQNGDEPQSSLRRFNQKGGDDAIADPLRRWRVDRQGQGTNISGVSGRDGHEKPGELIPARRRPLDLRGGYGAVLQGRPVVTDRP